MEKKGTRGESETRALFANAELRISEEELDAKVGRDFSPFCQVVGNFSVLEWGVLYGFPEI